MWTGSVIVGTKENTGQKKKILIDGGVKTKVGESAVTWVDCYHKELCEKNSFYLMRVYIVSLSRSKNQYMGHFLGIRDPGNPD